MKCDLKRKSRRMQEDENNCELKMVEVQKNGKRENVSETVCGNVCEMFLKM